MIEPARTILETYEARDAAQAEFRASMLEWIERFPENAHRRSCLEGHLTGSALLLDHARERVLLHHHRKLGMWLQFGGHCDGDGDLRRVALRETIEESGITPEWMSDAPFDLDIHSIPACKAEPEHLHLDVRFLATAPDGAKEECSEESRELRWFTLAEALKLDIDGSLRRMIEFSQL